MKNYIMRGTGEVKGEERKREGTVSKGKTFRGKRSGIGRRKESKCEKSRNREIVNRANTARE